MEAVFSAAEGPLRGRIAVPGDKSLSHRAVLFSAMAEGVSQVSGVLDSADVRSTINVVEALGADVALVKSPDGSLYGEITGWGGRGPVSPDSPLDCGNSGTTVRLVMGVLAGWPTEATLTGDESLSRRPMLRVTKPLAEMGARFETASGGTLPVRVCGSATLLPLDYASPVASAQVKSAILLAGTRAHGRTRVTEPALSRDHTERLLPAFGVDVTAAAGPPPSAAIEGPAALAATSVAVPGDPSSAAFMAAAAILVAGSEVVMEGVSLNPSRIGFLNVLERMGASIDVSQTAPSGNEPVGAVTVRHVEHLRATTVLAEEVPALVDEVPVLALVASAAHGTTRFEGIGELRVKESDRLAAIVDGLGALGVSTRSGDDWLEIDGPARLRGAFLDSLGDHRLAMCWALAGLVSSEPVTIERFEAVEVSYPRFALDLMSLGA